MELVELVKSLIKQKSEGGYWDFKQCWHSNNVDLLKDIVCLANNTTPDMRDGYLIFGVENDTYKITGVSEDKNRKNQENVIGFLSSKSWSGEEIPDVAVRTIDIDGKEIDVLIVRNMDVTPYYLLEDYTKINPNGKLKTVIHKGVIYSRVGDRNTSSDKCATKSSTEFLWKKRFGLAGSDEYKVIKRLQNVDNWYSTDEYETLFNREYSDITIKKDDSYDLEVEISEISDETRATTATWVMDFPYLFTSGLNWNMGNNETGRRAKWDIFLENRKLDISLFGVQGTKQTYYHIEPKTYFFKELGLSINSTTDSIQYYVYTKNSVEYLAFKLFFEMQCYRDDQRNLNRAFTVIPVFENEQEHDSFIEYVKQHKDGFKSDVENQSTNEMFPTYAATVPTVVVYKLGKALVQWLDTWRQSDKQVT